ncbi:MAG TPA: GNAT family N-acetyltransferase [Roseiflexaceae bacterium]|nr:GNAT family N-acetyltransferase [Roseiflexaceae bacterium]
MEIPPLNTMRLVLRNLQHTDAADVLVFRGDPVVQRFDDPPIHSLAEAEAFIGQMQAACARGEQQLWGITLRPADSVIGLVSLQQWNHSGDSYHRRAEIGYGIAHAHWGYGIGGEAVRAVLHYAFEVRRLNRIYARTIADNHESVRMLKRLGFVREGTQRQHSWEDDGTFHDSAMYGMIHSDWQVLNA